MRVRENTRTEDEIYVSSLVLQTLCEIKLVIKKFIKTA